MKFTAAGALILFARSTMGSRPGCPNGQVGVGYVQTCLIVNNMNTQCSASQGVIFSEGSCNQGDIESMFQKDGYCQPRKFNNGAKVFCQDDDRTVTSVAYNLAIWGNCKKQTIDCSSGANYFSQIEYCCEKIQG